MGTGYDNALLSLSAQVGNNNITERHLYKSKNKSIDFIVYEPSFTISSTKKGYKKDKAIHFFMLEKKEKT